MAKVRVYELARELDMDSKILVDKLNAGGLEVKNYMSTLDESSVAKAREIVSGAVSEVVEEKRIKPTVIRRRKKVVVVEQAVPEAPPEEKSEAQVVSEVKTGPAVTAQAKAGEKTKEREQEEAAAEAKAGVAVPVTPAQEEIEAPVPEEPAVKPPEPETKKPPVPKEEPPALKEKPPAPKEEAGPPEKQPKPRPKKGKKKKIERPAKIILRPEEGPLKDILARQAEEKAAAAPPRPVPTMPVIEGEEEKERPKKGKTVKKKREKKVIEVGEAADRGTLRRRKKEVYERADLYNGKPRRAKAGAKAAKKGKEVGRKLKHTEITVPKAIKRKIRVQEFVTVTELAKAMGTKATELMKRLINLGAMVNINQPIDFDTASVVAEELNFELELDTFEEESLFKDIEDRPEDLVPRPPVVTIMGHVDHGKTSLLDYIRKSNIIGSESGGITQHIGAYYVKTDGGDIAFLDTPGHEAFTAMRARGAKVTDIIVLVVAADDGAMPQTKEAINHARAAEIPIVVAVNKMDKPDADPDKVKRELAELGLAPEEWGGETLWAYISAKTGQGMDDLLSLILLQAEILELKGNPNRDARGTVIEAELDKSRGPVATVLVKNGSLRQGNQFVCGEYYGRVRAMLDHRGRKIKVAGPSVPVKLYGISGVPMAGDEFIVVKNEKTAKQIIEHRRSKPQKQDMARRGSVSLDDLFDRINKGDIKELNVVLKADVQGSVEALSDSLVKQSTSEVKLNIIHSATGAITESDVMLASASGAIIIGFNVRANPRVVELAERENVDIRYYDVIYNVIKDVRLAMAGLLAPVLKEHVIGRAEVKEIFRVPKVGAVAGCQVTDGHVDRNAHVRLLRDDVVVFDGKVASLRRFKEDVKEVQTGYECGIGLENFSDIKPADIFEVYEVQEVAPEL
ncbi:MAG: translation initiation factor IF-2 [Desulfococcus sp. 4484_242]|nr:MAG: translation initiation factor IF-2 [Desulfococcus sp. 4484_242]